MPTDTLDVRGLLCPIPILQLQKTIQKMPVGAVLTVLCSDPGTLKDIPIWCKIHGHDLLKEQRQDGLFTFLIQKKSTSPQKLRLSVTMITLNAEKLLEKSLASVDFADEIILVDAGSTDNTLAIARAHATVKIFETQEWQGFGFQKNYALSLASGQWIFSLDADEIVSEDLKTSLLQAMETEAFQAYTCQRCNFYYGHEIKHAGWGNDHLLRFFKRGLGQFSDDVVHEKIELPEAIPVGKLPGKLLHYSYADVSEVLMKMDRYSSLSAEKMRQKGQQASVFKALLAYFAGFFHLYFVRLGCLDGKAGLLLAIAHGQAKYYRILKLALMQGKL